MPNREKLRKSISLKIVIFRLTWSDCKLHFALNQNNFIEKKFLTHYRKPFSIKFPRFIIGKKILDKLSCKIM
ncbi:MAG: hypothetical protein RBG13Loki_1328 [Promethearchaeota archaeon CR_4]|nr:MAG: hypothetical protein RBG13Loki_1328 [Candidatus Lokiarchaeota archaeon CR_4]